MNIARTTEISLTRKNLSLKKMVISELPEYHRLCLLEGWEHGWNIDLYELSIFFHAKGSRSLALIHTDPEGKKIVAGGIWFIVHDNTIATMGLLVVKNMFRELGLGKNLWLTAFELVKNANIPVIMHSVVNPKIAYSLDGFEPVFNVENWMGYVETKKWVLPPPSSEVEYRLLTDSLVDLAVEYDKSVFSASRRSFIEGILHSPDSYGYVAMSGNTVRGVGLIRPRYKGFSLGMLSADNEHYAKDLAIHLIDAIKQPDPLIIANVPIINENSRAVVEFLGLKHSSDGDTVGIKYGNLPAVMLENFHKNFALFALETG